LRSKDRFPKILLREQRRSSGDHRQQQRTKKVFSYLSKMFAALSSEDYRGSEVLPSAHASTVQLAHIDSLLAALKK
jgi:hypothetical protein